MTIFKDHFSAQSAGYAAHRPTYPRDLVDALADAAPRQSLALDCACGTGQLSVLLASRFEAVVATDASAEQIAHATPHARIRYGTAPAERSGLPESSVDLVTVAQAAHWLELPAFYAEVRRIARPGAILALVTYGVLHVDDPAVDAVMQHFYGQTLGPHWPPERRHVEDGYRALPFPFPEIGMPDLAIALSWNLPDLIGYTETWSAVRAIERAIGRAPIAAFQDALASAWGDPDAQRAIRWPLSLRAGRL
ncbi:SAM-dependent methyltransferase [Methylobacterium sp. Leaf104]|uniref:class I SAM-dependent methyltransferase n=1 Tax=Methylobacterium TaxID=407 RepID=UPI0006FF2EFB|nr:MULTISPECIES: class I SAM-dependent methyltransferase [Methylobacterium]KQP41034.1 SAM-dependent methyltransferase [Methylobacterium sp. Leaf104]MCI9882578.1 class I SAM-dependent methyltransferase [Methylobacterium goesingense]